jgi:hypothetical protein
MTADSFWSLGREGIVELVLGEDRCVVERKMAAVQGDIGMTAISSGRPMIKLFNVSAIDVSVDYPGNGTVLG